MGEQNGLTETKDRNVFRKAKHDNKRLYTLYGEAVSQKGQYIYWCKTCQGYHRTSYPQNSSSYLEALANAIFVRDVWLFPNGIVAVTDQNGNQINELQGRFTEVVSRVLRCSDVDTVFHGWPDIVDDGHKGDWRVK